MGNTNQCSKTVLCCKCPYKMCYQRAKKSIKCPLGKFRRHYNKEGIINAKTTKI